MTEIKPGDVYIGVVELFSVALPGSLLMAGLVVITPPAYGALLGPFATQPEAIWVAFAFAAYTLGSFILPAASRIDGLYAWYRYRLRRPHDDTALNQATALTEAFFKTDRMHRPMNTYSWAKSLLLLRAPAASNTILRHEAESKFFRSLIVVLLILGLLFALFPGSLPKHDPSVDPRVLPWGAAVFIVCSFFCYADRRSKALDWAYRYALMLQLSPEPIVGQALPNPPPE